MLCKVYPDAAVHVIPAQVPHLVLIRFNLCFVREPSVKVDAGVPVMING